MQGEHPEHKGKSDPKQLAIVERYFAQVMDIPQLQARVECFLFAHQFASNATRVSQSSTCYMSYLMQTHTVGLPPCRALPVRGCTLLRRITLEVKDTALL